MTEELACYHGAYRAGGNAMAEERSLTLFRGEIRPGLRSFGLAELHDNGDVELSWTDSGPELAQSLDIEQYECNVRVLAAERDALLLALIAELYAGKPDAATLFRKMLEARGIPHQQDIWRS
jgi:hypothetical protein